MSTVTLSNRQWEVLQKHLVDMRETLESEAGTENCIHTSNPKTMHDISDRLKCHKICTCGHECGKDHVDIGGWSEGAEEFAVCTHLGCICTKFVDKEPGK